MSLLRRFTVLAIASAIAGCGSATDATSFTAPPGYTSAMSIGPFAQVWRGPKSQRSGIILTALPTEIEFSKIGENSSVKDAQILTHQDVKICGNQDAYYLSMVGESQTIASSPDASTEAKQRVDVIATHLNGKTYMAMYVRPQGTPADAAAESAIHGICPK